METLRNFNLSVVTATTPKVQTVVITVYGRNSKGTKSPSLKSWNPMGSKEGKWKVDSKNAPSTNKKITTH